MSEIVEHIWLLCVVLFCMWSHRCSRAPFATKINHFRLLLKGLGKRGCDHIQKTDDEKSAFQKKEDTKKKKKKKKTPQLKKQLHKSSKCKIQMLSLTHTHTHTHTHTYLRTHMHTHTHFNHSWQTSSTNTPEVCLYSWLCQEGNKSVH